jgi:hypothetical protein
MPVSGKIHLNLESQTAAAEMVRAMCAPERNEWKTKKSWSPEIEFQEENSCDNPVRIPGSRLLLLLSPPPSTEYFSQERQPS